MDDRRATQRRELIYYPPVFHGTSDEILGHAANISTEGVMLVGETRVEPNIGYQLRMDLPVVIEGQRCIEFNATSRWCKRNGHGDLFSSGFELEGISPRTFEVINWACAGPGFVNKERLTARRVLDVVLSLSVLILTLPITLVIGVVTKLNSRGPVLFAAERVGKLGRLFRMYKFRTMTESPGGSGPRITAHDDPRITGIGRFLRQTKLNELPQVINVLKGDMSLVGPRPEDPEFVAHYTPDQREVLTVQPGITSLATILYASEEQMLSFSDVTEKYLESILPDKLQLDLLYVRNRCMLLDLDILVQTMLVLIPRLRRAAPRVEEVLMGPVRTARRHLSWFAIDVAVTLLAIGLAGGLWRSAGPMDIGLGRALIAALLIGSLFSLMNWLTGVQRIQWRYASASEASGVVISAAAATVLVLIANRLLSWAGFPSQMLIVAGVFAAGGFLGVRHWRRLVRGLPVRFENLRSGAPGQRERVLVVGAGDVGQLIISLLRNSPTGGPFHVVGVVDDNFDLLGTLVHRAPVLGICDRIPDVVREKRIDTIVFAIHAIDERRRHEILQTCRETGARTVMVPDLLRSLRRSATGEKEMRASDSPTVGSSQDGAAYGGDTVDLRHEIHVLAVKARSGDTASVVSGLNRLDMELEQIEAGERMGLPRQTEPSLYSGDEAYPLG